LKKLKKERKIKVVKGKFLWNEEEVVTGKVIPYPAGFGFLEVEGREKDIYIPPFELQKVMGGDVVRAKVVEFRGKKEVRIERVIRRAKRELVGRVKRLKEGCILEPLDENTHLVFQLSKKDCSRIEEGIVVVAKITCYPNRENTPRAKIKEILGHPEKRFLAIDLLIRKHNLPTEYPPEVLREVEEIPDEIPADELERRKDLRDQICFTIDPEKAREREGTALDREAYRRGFTFYLPDRALHMLPEKLAADLCSLRPAEDRLAFTCEMVFDKKGDLLLYDIYESVIKSKARLTYAEALSLIVGDPALENKFPHLVDVLRLMEDLYRILSRKRWEKGSIDFDLPEAEVVVDEFGEPTAVVPYERHIAHKIIEQFMISANETVALHLESLGYPCLYRVHEPPDEEKVENLLEILTGLGYRLRKPRVYRSEEHLVRFLTLRAMSRAKYSPHNLGHFGLASEHYAHFTSPIRRYPDIVVHRLLKKAIKGKEIDHERWVSYLEEAGEHLSRVKSTDLGIR